MLIDATSLSRTVDALNAAQFDDRALSPAERREAAAWIAARQGLEGAYGGTFAGFPAERTKGIALFTGERIGSAPELERVANRPDASAVYARRRQALARRILF